MKTSGRNQPCPCGSGKKRKLCCLAEQEAIERERKRAQWSGPAFELYEEPLDRESNTILDLIDAGKLNEAEQAALELEQKYPEVFDGPERRARVYMARGERRKAAEYFRKAADIAEQYDGLARDGILSIRKQAEEQERLAREGQ